MVGSSWKGIAYVRMRPAKRQQLPSPAQLDARLRFALVARFVQTMRELVMRSFHTYADRMTGINSAVSYNLKNAVTGNAPGYTLAYPLVLVSRGDLPGAVGTSVAAGATPGTLVFNWADNSGVGKSLPSDLVLLVAHCPAYFQTVYAIGPATRGDGEGGLSLAAFSGQTVHTWIGFFSADGKEVATSVYAGEVVVEL